LQTQKNNTSGAIQIANISLWKQPWFPYVFPFVLFLSITGLVNFFPSSSHILYITKTILVGSLLWFWRREYASDIAPKLTPAGYLLATVAGLLVLVLWILPESFLPQIGKPSGFNPYSFGWPQQAVAGLIIIRLAGAALVVPIMEELFWRSFILRYAINPDFRAVRLGTYSLFSFVAVVLLFGLEHHRVIQGMLAGIIYTWLVISQKSLRGCIIAHSVTNLGLGIYVLWTENWIFW
jgi:uncharacterized protein